MEEVNHSIDNRRIARQQEKAFAEASSFSLSITRPVLQYQAAIIRLWADTFEALANSFERQADMVTNIGHQAQQVLSTDNQQQQTQQR
jgi:hypothetical protein